MELIMPELGVFFWTVVAFVLVWALLRKFAWQPILNMLSERDASIENALNAAENARAEMQKLESKNEELIKAAKLEREKLLKEAQDIKDSMIVEAREQAKNETERMLENANKAINAEREKAFAEMKKEIVQYSIIIAEKILRKNFENKEEQMNLAEKYMQDLKVN